LGYAMVASRDVGQVLDMVQRYSSLRVEIAKFEVVEHGDRVHLVVEETLPWSDEARERIARAPEMVRGMLVKEIEGWVARNHQTRVDAAAVQAVKTEWQKGGVFHLDPDDPRNPGNRE